MNRGNLADYQEAREGLTFVANTNGVNKVSRRRVYSNFKFMHEAKDMSKFYPIRVERLPDDEDCSEDERNEEEIILSIQKNQEFEWEKEIAN